MCLEPTGDGVSGTCRRIEQYSDKNLAWMLNWYIPVTLGECVENDPIETFRYHSGGVFFVYGLWRCI